MKLRRVSVTNVRSFLSPAELILDGDISIIIGPNGGGKTNLLDIITTTLRRYFIKSWTLERAPQDDRPDAEAFRSTEDYDQVALQAHSRGQGEQIVEVDLEVTARDTANIAEMIAKAKKYNYLKDTKYRGTDLSVVGTWPEQPLVAGHVIRYTVRNGQLVNPQEQAERLFLQYLNFFEVVNWLPNETDVPTLSMPMLSLPVTRTLGGMSSSVSLPGFNEGDEKRQADRATSRGQGQAAMRLAIGRLARKYRLLELGNDTNEKFYADPQVQLLTASLKSLGFEWQLQNINPISNDYDVRLAKEGHSFLVGNASSGEKELLTYVFAIYALNVRDAVIVIDEPELHLHPRWQALLLNLFERLAADTGNQFVMATHSPAFVSPSSIQYVSRVFSKEQASNIVRLSTAELPEPRHLLSIVNSQNNEGIFFAGKVVLVEGISDKLAFKGAFQKLVPNDRLRSVEVVSVGGKGFFASYSAILKASKVPFAIIADRDYLEEVGSAAVKALFVDAPKDVAAAMRNGASLDGQALVLHIETAISTKNFEELKDIWTYIKSRHRKLKSPLDPAEQAVLNSEIQQQRTKGIFILARGDLEAYLPVGYKTKQVDKLIGLVGADDFWEKLPDYTRAEWTEICQAIFPN